LRGKYFKKTGITIGFFSRSVPESVKIRVNPQAFYILQKLNAFALTLNPGQKHLNTGPQITRIFTD
jgi:hypothetical protein